MNLIKLEYVFADKFWMGLIYTIAKDLKYDVPIVACAVDMNHRLILITVNSSLLNTDPTAHAEMLLIRSMAKIFNNYRLPRLSVYVIMEPCIMCYGAMLHARVERLVFGCNDTKFGVFSKYNGMVAMGNLNHKIAWKGGVMYKACSEIIKKFFKSKR